MSVAEEVDEADDATLAAVDRLEGHPTLSAQGGATAWRRAGRWLVSAHRQMRDGGQARQV
jgi:hypothetical protein